MTELVVRVADLCEAEDRVLRATTLRLGLGLAIILVAAGTIIGGMALLLGALYIIVAAFAGAAVAAVSAGVAALVTGGTLIWLGRRIGT
jgi:hypothetical protein